MMLGILIQLEIKKIDADNKNNPHISVLFKKLQNIIRTIEMIQIAIYIVIHRHGHE